MQRVAIVGCGGAGKTTLANELSRRLGIPVIHIDSHYWRVVDGQRVELNPEQWVACHHELIGTDAWIIEGMKFGVLAERLARADTAVHLDLSTLACLSGIVRRRIRFRGHNRSDLGIYDQVDWAFLMWVCSFRRKQRPALLAALSSFGGQTIVLRSRRDSRRFLTKLHDGPGERFRLD